jgi:hypothetical protein
MRIARGALTCWFGASGPLKGTYIYHADANPPSKGGSAEIEIHVKDPQAADPRSQRAFRISIKPVDANTELEVENLKVPEPLASRMKADVNRWSADVEGCGEGPITAGWGAKDAPAANSAAKKGPGGGALKK